MEKKELDELEAGAKKLSSSAEREKALRTVAALREYHLNGGRNILADHNAEVTRALREIVFGRLKFLFGALIFLILAVSLVHLTLRSAALWSLQQDVAAVDLALPASGAVISIVIFYLMWRKPKAERLRIATNPIARQFVKQILWFRVSALALIPVSVLAIFLMTEYAKGWPGTPFLVAFCFLCGYWLLARKFWRCPACGSRLSFQDGTSDLRSNKKCPCCHVELR